VGLDLLLGGVGHRLKLVAVVLIGWVHDMLVLGWDPGLGLLVLLLLLDLEGRLLLLLLLLLLLGLLLRRHLLLHLLLLGRLLLLLLLLRVGVGLHLGLRLLGSGVVDLGKLVLNLLVDIAIVWATSWHQAVALLASVSIGRLSVSIRSALLLVLLEDGQTVWQLELRLLHLKVANDALLLVVIEWGLNGGDSLDAVWVSWVQVLYLLVSNQSLIGLLALLIEDSKIVPDLWLQGVERCGFYNIFEGVTAVTILIINDGKCGPVGCLSRILEGSCLKKLKSLLEVALFDVAPSLDVQSVSLTLLELLDVLKILECLVDVSLDERAPGLMLVDLEVALVSDESGLILAQSLVVVSLTLIEETNLDQSVGLSLESEGVGQN